MKKQAIALSTTLALAIFSSCANALPATEHVAAAPVTSEQCSNLESIMAGLKIISTTSDDGKGDLQLSSDPEIGKLKIYNEIYLSGECAAHLTAYQDGIYYFGGVGLETLDRGKFQFLSTPPPFYLTKFSISASGPHPASVTGEFRSAIAVDVRGLTVTYVGIWQRGRTSTVYMFTRLVGGNFDGIVELFSSPSGVRAISYTPSPDSSLGGLDVWQDDKNGPKLTGISWDMPN